MTKSTVFLYHDDYLKYQFGPTHPFQPIREKYTLDLLRELKIFNNQTTHVQPSPATRDDLLTVHEEEYVDYVKRMCEIGKGYLDHGDTPATKDLYEGTCSVVGGSLTGARLIMENEVDHAFNPGGGLHHAHADRASGFCVFNDIAVTVRYLQQNYDLERILILDIDGHHGDGTQAIFYEDPILTISTHRIGIFPGTGYIDEIGKGNGKGYSVNIPLPGGTFHDAYIYAFNEIIPPLVKYYKPDFIIHQFGVDGHYQDPLVGLALTTETYYEITQITHKLAHRFAKGRLLLVGGGGYNVHNVARCWTIMFSTLSQTLPNDMTGKYHALFDKDVPLKDRTINETVNEVVTRVKRTVFPLLNLE
jgi:acetoin utilization protein AcuC